MDIVVVFLVGILLILGGVIYFGKSTAGVKSKAVKKDEIIEKYTLELKQILAKCETKEQKIEQKKIFLQGVSSELSRNIFFTQEEAKQLIQKLAVM